MQFGDMDADFSIRPLLHTFLLCGGKVFHGSGIDVFQERQHIEPHFVACIGVFQIGVVGHKVLLNVCQMGKNLLACQAQQGTHHIVVAWLHAAEPSDACSSHGIEQQSFYVVVLMMPYGNGTGLRVVQE